MNDKEKQAWEAYVDARLEQAEKSGEVSHEQAVAFTKELLEKLHSVPREMA